MLQRREVGQKVLMKCYIMLEWPYGMYQVNFLELRGWHFIAKLCVSIQIDGTFDLSVFLQSIGRCVYT